MPTSSIFLKTHTTHKAKIPTYMMISFRTCWICFFSILILSNIPSVQSFSIQAVVTESALRNQVHETELLQLHMKSNKQQQTSITQLYSSKSVNTDGNEKGSSSVSSKSEVDDENEESDDNTSEDTIIPTTFRNAKRRKMELAWCGRESCTLFEEGLREKVVGEHNEILFESPATGQVTYRWMKEDNPNGGQSGDNSTDVILARVLLLIKWHDDELLQVASEAVRTLTAKGDIAVLLPPDMAAKFKHYYGVDNDKIELFEPLNAQNGMQTKSKKQSDENDTNSSNGPDLICTLGGDGLLMYAAHLFPGPCPPILCVAGGSLGFLTPFSRDEMVDAIRISLGLGVDTDDDQFYYDGSGEINSWYGDIENTPQVPEYIASKMKPSYVDENGITWTGSYRIPKDDLKPNKKPTMRFGSSNQICMSTRMRLECVVINSEGVVRAKFNVLNEVVIDRGSSPYLAALECFCDNVHLTTVQADGIIFSTPTGSTAYSMAAGGSVVHPAVPAILVTPICPHVLSFRSMVFPDHVVLRCYVPEDARSEASVAFDGKHRRELHRGDSVQIQMSPYPVPTINRVDHSSDWLTSLKRNFNFNSRARQGPL